MKQRIKLLVFMTVTSLLLNLAVFPLQKSMTTMAAALPLVDDFETGLPSSFDANGVPIGFFAAQDGSSTVAFTTSAPPEPVPGVPDPNAVLKVDFNVASWGVVIHGFENAAVDTWVSQDWSAYGGISFWMYGNSSGTDLFVDVIDNRNSPPRTNDDAERFSVSFKDNFSGWQQIQLPFTSFTRKEIGNGAPNDGFTLTEVHGWAIGALTTPAPQTYYIDHVMLYGTAPVVPLTVGFGASSTNVKEGRLGTVVVKLSKPPVDPVTVNYATSDGTAKAGRDYLPASGLLTFAPGTTQQSFTVATLDDMKFDGKETVLLQLSAPAGADLGIPPVASLNIQDNDPYDKALLDDFEIPPYQFTPSPTTSLSNQEITSGSPLALPGQGAYEGVLQVTSSTSGRSTLDFERHFALGQDWSGDQGLSFWYYGNNSGRKIKVKLLDNQALDPGPAGWSLVWSDEFNSPAGTPPSQKNWGYEIGDGTINGIPGWGNSELEYYTSSTDNAATDGQGNLAITTRQADGSLLCYYGPCQYTSARLLTKNKFEVAYGRLEARIQVPSGAGLWPAFWSLGTDIDRVDWPQTGEIDFLEYVGRVPNQIFGTIHGPGYSGGSSFGGIYDFGYPVADDFHTYAVEWQPDEIRWYVDGILYHTATPADVAPNQWVFNHPFFLLLNLAVGGNFGGPVAPETVFPQSMLVDYVRLFQAGDTAERFEASFTDHFTGWQRIMVPFTAFQRSTDQPAGAPNDGLTLSNVWGYGFKIPGNPVVPVLIDRVRLQANCSYEVVVTSTADSGSGSLRQAISDVCFGGTIGFAPELANQTIGLTSTELTLARPVTIDGSGAPGLIISGSDTVRPFVVNAAINVTLKNLTVAHGFGWQLAGGILNNGSLTLDHVRVVDNRVATDYQDWWMGGSGIYSGDGSDLFLVDSTVSNNLADPANGGTNGGGIYAMFNSLVLINRSVVSGNSANVGGGLRSLGDVEITNSTFSGNSAYGWHGGAVFHTNGVLNILHSTIANNQGPDWASSTIFIGSFDASVPTLKLANTVISGNQWYACDHWTGSTNVISGGHNLVQDDTCSPVASDLVTPGAGIGPLADNGGPTWTHALLPGSPALDAADDSACPVVDQRGVARPQGSHCDIGAFEAQTP